jgi:hypothetical protein
MVVGAPGFSSGTGRIDVYAEGSEFASAVSCVEPTDTPTPMPTPNPTVPPAAGEGPIPVDQRTTGLPAPEVLVNKKSVEVVAPLLESNTSKLKFVGYLFTLIQTSRRASQTVEVKVFGFEALSADAFGSEAFGAAQSKKRELFARRNRVTFRNLKVGSYTASYRPVFTIKQGRVSKRVLGKISAKRAFSVGF